MKDKILMGFDFGTNGVKALSYSVNQKKLVASVYKGYPIVADVPNQSEHIPEEWWKAFRFCARKMMKDGAIEEEAVDAICVSSHTPTLTPVDRNGKVLSNGMIWADGRAVLESDALNAKYKDVIAKVNPAYIRPYHIVSKLAWFKENRKELYEKTEVFLDCSNYIVFRLTGKAALDRSMATNYHFYNVYTKNWDVDLAGVLGIDLRKFPKILDCDEIVGTLSDEAARELRMTKNVKVLAGGSDTAMAMLSTGIFTEDRLAYSCGTGSSVVMLTENSKKSVFKTDPRLITIGYTDKDYMMNIGVMSNTGGALKWLKDTVCEQEKISAEVLQKDVFALLSDYAGEISIGAGGVVFLPYLAGELTPLYNPNARGVFFGLSVTSSKKEMIRAVMEGSCYAVKQNLGIVLDAAGVHARAIKEIVATGGPCNSDVWMQMLSNILEIPVVIQEKAEGAAMGDVILAGCATGVFNDPRSAVEKLIKPGKKYIPNVEDQKKYNILYESFCEIQTCLIPCFDSHMERQARMQDI